MLIRKHVTPRSVRCMASADTPLSDGQHRGANFGRRPQIILGQREGAPFCGHSRCMAEPHKLSLRGSTPRPASNHPNTPGPGSNGEVQQWRDGLYSERRGRYALLTGAQRSPASKKRLRGGRTPESGLQPERTVTPKAGYAAAEDSRQVPGPTDSYQRPQRSNRLSRSQHQLSTFDAASRSHPCQTGYPRLTPNRPPGKGLARPLYQSPDSAGHSESAPPLRCTTSITSDKIPAAAPTVG